MSSCRLLACVLEVYKVGLTGKFILHIGLQKKYGYGNGDIEKPSQKAELKK